MGLIVACCRRSRSREEGDWSGAGKAGQSAGGYMLLSRQTPSRTNERHGVMGWWMVDGLGNDGWHGKSSIQGRLQAFKEGKEGRTDGHKYKH